MNAFAKYIAAQLIANYGKARATAMVASDLRKKVADHYALITEAHGMEWFNARAPFTDVQVMAAIHTEVQAL